MEAARNPLQLTGHTISYAFMGLRKHQVAEDRVSFSCDLMSCLSLPYNVLYITAIRLKYWELNLGFLSLNHSRQPFILF